MNYREVLLSILKLEEMKNWTNVSVSGGIDRFIENNKEKLFVINNSSSSTFSGFLLVVSFLSSG